MSTKGKGTRAERELFHMFWETGSYIPVRAAGSGSTPIPNPDLIVGNGSKTFAIECKAIKSGSKYFPKKEIDELRIFSERFGAEPWIGIRFDNEGWWFLDLNNLGKSKKDNFMISLDIARKRGLRFEELIGKFKQKRLV